LLHDVAARVAELLPDDVTHLASPEGAATLLLAATALAARLPLAVIRKEAKAYGTRATVEGYAPPGARVGLLEDVGTTGAQVLAAARELEASGAGVAVIVLAIDRGGGRRLRAAGYEVRAVVSLDGRG
jgi:orotate phosphoribosyltransferase